MLDRMSFSDDGRVVLVVDNVKKDTSYRMKGNEVTVIVEGDSLRFMLSGDNLESSIEGRRTVCSRL